MDKKRIFGFVEAAFDILYLGVVFALGLYLLLNAHQSLQVLCGVTALILAGGDSFHLIPRILSIIQNDRKRHQRALGRGKCITSVTMTVFYVLLWHIGLLLFLPEGAGVCTIVIYILAALRIGLCALPQNRWLDENPPVKWGIYRNLPFLAMGIMVLVLYAVYGTGTFAVKWMWLAVALSFAFYLPVVVGANRYPRLGMLMLPKSCAYIWIVAMFLTL